MKSKATLSRTVIAVSIDRYRLNRFRCYYSGGRRMISCRAVNCPSKLERVKTNTMQIFHLAYISLQLKGLLMAKTVFAFTRFYL